MRFLSSVSALLLISLLGCDQSSSNSAEPNKINRVIIDSLYTFTTFDDQDIAQPTNVEVLSNNQILISDYGTNKITSVSKNGEVNFTFGREGRGPGEFQNINDIDERKNFITVFDNHLYKISIFENTGEYSASMSFPSDVFNKNVALIKDSLYVFNQDGLEDSLFHIRSFTSDYELSFEAPRFKREGRINMAKSQNQLKAGQVPDFFKNMTILKSDGQHIYVFFEGYSEMAKYDLSGNLIWNRELNLPNNEQIFADVIESTKDHTGARSIPALQYIFDFRVYEDGIYVLTYPSSVESQQLVRINSKGYITDIFQLPEEPAVYDFDIDFEQNMAYFTSWNAGVVLKTEL